VLLEGLTRGDDNLIRAVSPGEEGFVVVSLSDDDVRTMMVRFPPGSSFHLDITGTDTEVRVSDTFWADEIHWIIFKTLQNQVLVYVWQATVDGVLRIAEDSTMLGVATVVQGEVARLNRRKS
jgi:hypothetical protein